MREKWLAKGLCCEHLGTELHEAINQRDEARGQRDRLENSLCMVFNLIDENSQSAKDIAEKALQSLTTNEQ